MTLNRVGWGLLNQAGLDAAPPDFAAGQQAIQITAGTAQTSSLLKLTVGAH